MIFLVKMEYPKQHSELAYIFYAAISCKKLRTFSELSEFAVKIDVRASLKNTNPSFMLYCIYYCLTGKLPLTQII